MTVNNNRYEKYDGQERVVSLPSHIDGMPLQVIGSKAFLSCKSVERLVLPDTLEKVENWGFAHMKSLREIEFPVREIVFGRQVFLGCESLKRVVLRREGGYEGIPCFLASMFCHFPQGRLEDLPSAGDPDGQWRWLKNYDDALEIFLRQPDDTGFEPAFIGWFDVEDVDDQKQDYMLRQRKEKILLSFQRLLYDEALGNPLRRFLRDMISANSVLVTELFCGTKMSSEADPYCKAEMSYGAEIPYGKDIRYYKIWKETGGLTGQLAGELLMTLPQDVPEIRAYLIEIQMNDEGGSGKFFSELEL